MVYIYHIKRGKGSELEAEPTRVKLFLSIPPGKNVGLVLLETFFSTVSWTKLTCLVDGNTSAFRHELFYINQEPITDINAFSIGASSDSINPLSPSIHVQILQTDLHTFP